MAEQFSVKKCIACGKEVRIPFVGIKNPRPSQKRALCERPACITARGERLAIVQTQNMREPDGASGINEIRTGGPSGVCAQTSEGAVSVEEERDEEHVIADEAAKEDEKERLDERESELEKKGKRHRHSEKKAAPPPVVTTLPRHPAYIKSVAIPAVPTHNSDAPFGLDDNGRPLVPIQSDQNLMEDLKQKPWLKKTYTGLPTPAPRRTVCDCNQPWCSICHPESAKLGVVPLTPAYRPPTTKPPTYKPIRPLGERTQLPPTREIGSYKTVLGLEPVDIANFFDENICTRQLVDVPTLKDKGGVESELEAVKFEIVELTALSKTRTRQYQKFFRPDDMLTSKELKQRRRKDEQELKILEEKKNELQARLRNWESDSRNFELVKQRKLVVYKFETLHPITYRERTVEYGWHEDSYEDPLVKGGTPLCSDQEKYFGEVYDIAGYRALIAGKSTKNWTTMGWLEWENLVILTAIERGLVEPNEAAILAHPALRGRGRTVDEIEIDHEHERTLIKKTGGAELGGASIFSAGYRNGNGKLRQLASFDATMDFGGRGRGEPGATYDDDTTLSDELETFNPD